MISPSNAIQPSQADTPEAALLRFAEDVASSLVKTPRRLPSRYLYDALGSALFEAICQLPWYRVTRAETALLGAHGEAILAACQPLTDIVELGPGNGDKLARLLKARHDDANHLNVHLIDVSLAALSDSALRLGQMPGLQVSRHQATYEVGLAGIKRDSSHPGRMLSLMLGSNLGNFDPIQANRLLCQIHSTLKPDDAFLLGADLVKSEHELQLAYDDPLGVTAAFNYNLLLRINRELGGDFDLDGFTYRAVWNAKSSRMEAHLVSTRTQTVSIPKADLTLTLQDGDTIWTESAYKYSIETVFALLEDAGFTRVQSWVEETAQFALALVRS